MQMRTTSRPRLIIHGGMPKTGTSSIQTSLCSSRWSQVLDNGKVRFLNVGGGNYTAQFHSLRGLPGQRTGVEHEAIVEKMTGDICNLVAKLPAGFAVLVSAEAFGDIAVTDSAALQRIREYFEQYFSDISVVFYLRDPLSYACSRIQQGVKAGLTIQQALRMALLTCDSAQAIRNVRNIFGETSLTIRAFDSALMTSSDVVKDFASNILGVPQTTLDAIVEKKASAAVNMGLPGEVLEPLQRFYSARSIEPANVSALFIQILGRIKWAGTKFDPAFFSEDDRKQLLAVTDKARADVRELMEYDLFPSYSPWETGSVDSCGTADIDRRNAQLLQRAIARCAELLGDHERQTKASRAAAILGRGKNLGEINRDTVQRLLGALYALCERQKVAARNKAKQKVVMAGR